MTKKKKDHKGESEENVYQEETRADLVESDAISAEEEGFMAGYDKADEEAETKEKAEDEVED